MPKCQEDTRHSACLASPRRHPREPIRIMRCTHSFVECQGAEGLCDPWHEPLP